MLSAFYRTHFVIRIFPSAIRSVLYKDPWNRSVKSSFLGDISFDLVSFCSHRFRPAELLLVTKCLPVGLQGGRGVDLSWISDILNGGRGCGEGSEGAKKRKEKCQGGFYFRRPTTQVCKRVKLPIGRELILVSVFLLPMDGVLVHRGATP